MADRPCVFARIGKARYAVFDQVAGQIWRCQRQYRQDEGFGVPEVVPFVPFAGQALGSDALTPTSARRLENVKKVEAHGQLQGRIDRKSTRLNYQSLMRNSYAVFCLKKKNQIK